MPLRSAATQITGQIRHVLDRYAPRMAKAIYVGGYRLARYRRCERDHLRVRVLGRGQLRARFAVLRSGQNGVGKARENGSHALALCAVPLIRVRSRRTAEGLQRTR